MKTRSLTSRVSELNLCQAGVGFQPTIFVLINYYGCEDPCMSRDDALPLMLTSALLSFFTRGFAMAGRRGRQSKAESTLVQTQSIEQDIANLEKSANTLWYSIRESSGEAKSFVDLVREIEESKARATHAPSCRYHQGMLFSLTCLSGQSKSSERSIE